MNILYECNVYKQMFQSAILFFRLLNKNELQTIPDGTFRNLQRLRLVYVSDLKQARSDCRIDLFPNGGQMKYSFLLMLTSLATTIKFQKYIYILYEGCRSN